MQSVRFASLDDQRRHVSRLLAEYLKLPDPPDPGTEDWQLGQLRNTVAQVAGFLANVARQFPLSSEKAVEDEVERLISPHESRKGTYHEAVIYDACRSIVVTARNRAGL